jgi:drug/metabolite transporter (DMT)-like permease
MFKHRTEFRRVVCILMLEAGKLVQSRLTVGTIYTDHRKGLLFAGIGGLAFTLDVPLIRLAGSDEWTVMFVRGLMIFLVLFGHWAWTCRYRGNRQPFVNGVEGLVASFLFVAANFMFMFAVHNTYAANVVFMMAMNPLFAAILSWVFLSEKIENVTWVAAGLAMMGVVIIVFDGVQQGNWLGDAAAFGVSFLLACSLIWMRRSGKDMTYAPGFGSLMAAMLAFGLAKPLSLDFVQFSYLGLNGLLFMPLSFALIAMATRYIRAPEIALFLFLDTILTPVWMWMLMCEMPTAHAILGGAIVTLALVGHTLWRYKYSARMPSPQSLK